MTDYTWIGIVSTDASVADNWLPIGVPSTGDKAIFEAGASQGCNFNISALDEIEIASDFIWTVDIDIDIALIGLSVSVAGSIVCGVPRSIVFSGTPLYKSASCYIEIGTSDSPFDTVFSRENLIFSVAPSTGDLYFDTGIYPNMKLAGAGNKTPQYIAPTVADTTDVNFYTLRLSAGAFGPASATPTDNDKLKNFIIDSSSNQLVVDAGGMTEFDGGYATWTFQGASAGFLIPTSNLPEYQNCDFTFRKMSIVATDAGAGAWAKISANSRLCLNDFTVGVGASVKGAGASAIHLINRPTIKGTWGFFPIADGIYHHKDGEVLGVAHGGTGLSNVGEYEIPFGSEGNTLNTSPRFTFDNNLNELTVDGKLTVSGLIDPTGLELTPVAANPGGVAANTIWINTSDSNRLYYGSSHISGGGGGGGGGGAETDPIFSASPAASITNAGSGQVITAAERATLGTALQAETDPIFSASAAASITNAGSGDVSQGDTAFAWGDHAAAGYLTSAPPETDPVFAASEAALLVSGDKAVIDGALQTTGGTMTGEIEGTTITLNAVPADPATDAKVRLGESGATSNMLRIQTDNGYIDIGPNNSGYAHIYTDRSRFYFNKEIIIDGGGYLFAYNDGLKLGTGSNSGSGTTAITIADGSPDITVSGQTESTAFVKTGGLATEFLMADGSVSTGSALQYARWFGINTGAIIYNLTSGVRQFINWSDVVNFAESSTGLHPAITLVSGPTDFINLAAGGIYQITVSMEMFPNPTPPSLDRWLEISTDPLGNRALGTARLSMFSSSAGNWNAQKTVLVEIPTTDPPLDVYISAYVNGGNCFIRAYDDNRISVAITRLGDASI